MISKNIKVLIERFRHILYTRKIIEQELEKLGLVCNMDEQKTILVEEHNYMLHCICNF